MWKGREGKEHQQCRAHSQCLSHGVVRVSLYCHLQLPLLLQLLLSSAPAICAAATTSTSIGCTHLPAAAALPHLSLLLPSADASGILATLNAWLDMQVECHGDCEPVTGRACDIGYVGTSSLIINGR